jgi:hypothetical protein
MLKMNGGEPLGSWPDSPSKHNTNQEPHDETLHPVGLEGDALVRQELVQDTHKPSKGKDTFKRLNVAMLPPEIIER